MVVCSVHFLALAFSLKAVFVCECACVRSRACVGVPACFLCASVLKAERQSPWLMLHVKLKLAPPEHCNTLRLTTTTCPEMTAGRAPIPINPYFPLYCAHLHSFLPAEASSPSHTRAGFILLYRRREQFQREGKKNERENLSIGRKGGRLRMWEKELTIYHLSGPIETTGWSIFHFNCQYYLRKICQHRTGYSKEQLPRHSFVPFKWGSIEGQPYNINTNMVMLHFGDRSTNTATQQTVLLHSQQASYCVVKCRVDAGIWVQTGFVACQLRPCSFITYSWLNTTLVSYWWLVAFSNLIVSVCKRNTVLPALAVRAAFFICLSLSSSGSF